MKRKCIMIFMIALTLGMTACSSESKEDVVSVETDSLQETDRKENTDTKLIVDSLKNIIRDNQ